VQDVDDGTSEPGRSSLGRVPRPRTLTPRPSRIVTRLYGPGEAPDRRATYFAEISGLRQALLWSVATRRQLDRWEALVAEQLRCEIYENERADGIVIWEAEAERHFTFVAARNLLRAIEVSGLPVQVDPLAAETIRSVRDLLEHWDENRPVFNVWPHDVQPPRPSGQRFANRNPGLTPYDPTAWSGLDGPKVAPELPASRIHSLLDDVEREVIVRSPMLAEYVPVRPPSPWLGDGSGTYRWWPTRPGSDIVPRQG
jgi:hypothetical protein